MEEYNIENIIGAFLFISLISIITLTTGIIILGTGNDLGLGTLYQIEEDMVTNGIITDSRVISQTEDINQIALDWFGYLDLLWLLAYSSLSLLMFIFAYFSQRLNFFTFSNLMYIGIFFILFILDFISIATFWIKDEVLLNILPTAISLIPKFMFFLDHIAIIISIQLSICLVLNVIDFDFITEKLRKKKENNALTQEVL